MTATLVTADDLARVQARAKVKAQALVAGPVPLHLMADTLAGDAGVPPDQVMRARMMGMAQAIGTLAAALGDLGAIVGDCQVAMSTSLEQALAADDTGRARLVSLCNQAMGVENV